MKIIITTQTFPPKVGGMQSVMRSLTEKFGKEFKTIVLPNHYVSKKTFKETENIKIFNSILPKFLKPFIKRLIIRIIGNKEDIFICDSWKSVNSIPHLFSENIFVLAHGQELIGKKNHSTKIIKSLSRVKAIISNSSYTMSLAKKISKKLNYVIPPTYMLPNNIIKKTMINDVLNILTIARIEERKGIFNSLKALHRIYISNKKIKFLWHIVGDGPQLNQIKKYIYDNKLEKIVICYGFVSEKVKENLFFKSDIFLMPSFRFKNSIEGFGIVYSEAARYGIPSIIGIDGGSNDAVINNQTGWSVDGKEPKILEKKLVNILSNRNQIIKYGQASQKLYLENFTGECVFNKFKEILIN